MTAIIDLFYAPPTPSGAYAGDVNALFDAIDTGGGIEMSRDTGRLPAFVQVSASRISATGVVLDANGNPIDGADMRPYERLEYTWDFGDPDSTELCTDPRTGAPVNLSTDQRGPEAAYVYRKVGSYTITLSIRGAKAGGGFVTASATAVFAAMEYVAAATFYYDSVNGSDTDDGLSPTTPRKTLWGATGDSRPFDNLGQLLTPDAAIYLANGSTFEAPEAVIQPAAAGALRLMAYSNPAFPSSVKPIVRCTRNYYGHGAISYPVNSPIIDQVISGIVFAAGANCTAAGMIMSFARNHPETGTVHENGSISNGTVPGEAGDGAGTMFTFTETLIGQQANLWGHAAQWAHTLFDEEGLIAPNTKVTGGSYSQWSVNNEQQVGPIEVITLLPDATCAAFTGHITDDVLRVSAPPGWSSLDGAGTAGVGQVMLDRKGKLAPNTFITEDLGDNHYRVTPGGQNVHPELMFSGTPGPRWRDIYVDNCEVVSESNFANGWPITAADNDGVDNRIRLFVDTTYITDQNYYTVHGLDQHNLEGLFQVNKFPTYVELKGTGTGDPSGEQIINFNSGAKLYAGSGGIQINVGGANMWESKDDVSNIAIWNTSVNLMNYQAGAAVNFGAFKWQSFVGVSVTHTGPGIPIYAQNVYIHQFNPETSCDHLLCRYCRTDAGGDTMSGVNFSFQPRSQNMRSMIGDPAGDYVGKYVLVADSKFSYATNCLGFDNQHHMNPGTPWGYYTHVVVERVDMEYITQTALMLNSVADITIRDLNVSHVSQFIISGNVGNWLRACIYRNNVYRPSNADQLTYGGAGAPLDNPMWNLTDEPGDLPPVPYTMPQTVTDNVFFDDRDYAAIIRCMWPDQVAAGSVFARNNYWSPNYAACFREGPAPSNHRTLAEWQKMWTAAGVDATTANEHSTDPGESAQQLPPGTAMLLDHEKRLRVLEGRPPARMSYIVAKKPAPP